MAEKSIKASNIARLVAAVVLNAVLFLAVFNLDDLLGLKLTADLLDTALASAAMAVIVSLLASQLSSNTKARLAFLWWKHPLPGSYAFTRYGPEDDRVNMDLLDLKFGPLPSDPTEQNKLWYKLYLTVQDKPSVRDAHRDFLFYRELLAVLLLVSIVAVPAAFLLAPDWAYAAIYSGVVLVQLLLVQRAARNHGIAFVCNVLALKSAGK